MALPGSGRSIKQLAPLGMLITDSIQYPVTVKPVIFHGTHSQVEDATVPAGGMISPRKRTSSAELRAVHTPRVTRMTHDEGS